jgi:uncharacterized protein YkwD
MFGIIRIAAMALALVQAADPAAAQTVPAEVAGDRAAQRALALNLVNRSREAQGLDALETGATLDRIAQAHAEDMATREYYAHVSPEGENVLDRFLDAGGSEWELVAENIARCRGCPETVDEARIRALHEGWMNSPGHRANILADGLTRFGFGVSAREGDLYAVQTFAGPGATKGTDTTPLGSDAVLDAALERINAARQAAGHEALVPAPDLDRAAAELVPQDLSGFSLDTMGSLEAALPSGSGWRRVTALASTCGGCGSEIVAGDIEGFIGGWLAEGGAYRDTLLDPAWVGMGLALRADGAGRKLAVALLGAADAP